MTIPLQQGIVYGPIQSRRLGSSLGINILPEGSKHCNFNCPYCQYGWTPAAGHAPAADWPAPQVVEAAVSRAVQDHPAIDRLTLAGNGEPTLHPQFPAIVDRLRTIRDRVAPDVKIAVLSNSSTLENPEVVQALAHVDERYMKLDAGSDDVLVQMNGCRVPVRQIVDGLVRLNSVILQSMFARDARRRVDNTTPDAVMAWLAAVKRVRPVAVHVYTLDRSPAWNALERVPVAALTAIAAAVEAEGIRTVVF